ncbi:MAG: phospholipase D-like domain-containing protein [Candidatus Contendobacter sp.]|nr:phospholipase D-like domain-containing protein [Candidatus Contendobacter sp.]
MSSNAWQMLGKGSVLGHLRADLKQASAEVWVVGPWIDAFFAQILAGSLPAAPELRVITRPLHGASDSFKAHASAARLYFEERPNTVVKLLDALHAKVIVIDETVVYCGSANWYRYSLEEGCELVLRGPAIGVDGLLDALQTLWDQATHEPLPETPAEISSTSAGYTKEIIDPIAAAKLEEVPGSFVIQQRNRRR